VFVVDIGSLPQRNMFGTVAGVRIAFGNDLFENYLKT
jgi:hypothetical protein